MGGASDYIGSEPGSSGEIQARIMGNFYEGAFRRLGTDAAQAVMHASGAIQLSPRRYMGDLNGRPVEFVTDPNGRELAWTQGVRAESPAPWLHVSVGLARFRQRARALTPETATNPGQWHNLEHLSHLNVTFDARGYDSQQWPDPDRVVALRAERSRVTDTPHRDKEGLEWLGAAARNLVHGTLFEMDGHPLFDHHHDQETASLNPREAVVNDSRHGITRTHEVRQVGNETFGLKASPDHGLTFYHGVTLVSPEEDQQLTSLVMGAAQVRTLRAIGTVSHIGQLLQPPAPIQR